MLTALKQENIATHATGYAAAQAMQTAALFRTGPFIAVPAHGKSIAFMRCVEPDPGRCNCMLAECKSDRHDNDVQTLGELDPGDREADLQLWLSYKARQICQAECRREGAIALDVQS